jgi:hypothetical protein
MPEEPAPTNARPVLILLAGGNFALAIWIFLASNLVEIPRWVRPAGLLYLWAGWLFLGFVLNLSFRIAMALFIAFLILVFVVLPRLHG